MFIQESKAKEFYFCRFTSSYIAAKQAARNAAFSNKFPSVVG